MFRDEIKIAAASFQIKFSDIQLNQFDIFYKTLIEWNQKINLTTITEPKDFAIKHIIDSISLWDEEKLSNIKTVIDIGTGAGFPGIPLKICRPHLQIYLIDSLNKRVSFLKTVVDKLQFDNVFCIHSRAEDLAHKTDFRENFDLVTSRAVARLNVLSEYCLPFVKLNGIFIALKGSDIKEEIEESFNAIKKLGGDLPEVVNIHLPNGDTRNIIYVKKISKTSNNFPRKAGFPDKKPLN